MRGIYLCGGGSIISLGFERISVLVLGTLDVLLLAVDPVGIPKSPRAIGELEHSRRCCFFHFSFLIIYWIFLGEFHSFKK